MQAILLPYKISSNLKYKLKIILDAPKNESGPIQLKRMVKSSWRHDNANLQVTLCIR